MYAHAVWAQGFDTNPTELPTAATFSYAVAILFFFATVPLLIFLVYTFFFILGYPDLARPLLYLSGYNAIWWLLLEIDILDW
jgi:hypothetical protein